MTSHIPQELLEFNDLIPGCIVGVFGGFVFQRTTRRLANASKPSCPEQQIRRRITSVKGLTVNQVATRLAVAELAQTWNDELSFDEKEVWTERGKLDLVGGFMAYANANFTQFYRDNGGTGR